MTNLDDKDLRDRALEICREHLGGAWSDIQSEDMSFTAVTGGMSNLLFCCTLPDSIESTDGQPTQVLLRLYGEASRNCDMSLQVQIFELLSNKELGPKLYANFDDGRLEEFLPATSLTCNELMNHDISSIIAKKLATVHSLDVPNMRKDNTWITARYNEWLEFIDSNRQLPDDLESSLKASTRKIAKTLLAINFEKEIKFMTKIFEGTKSPIVFSHNDLHQGNILLVKPTKRRPQLEKRVILIDFEYCSYNYRGYDIANHFSEWCFEYDTPEHPHYKYYSERFPSKDTQREFIRNYLNQKKKSTSKNGIEIDHSINLNNNTRYYQNGSMPKANEMTTGKFLDNIEYSNGHHYHRSSVVYHHPNGTTITSNGKTLKLQATDYDKEVDAILSEVVPFCMAANLVWTMWCIKSAYASNIKFGYWEHAMTRWENYSNLKQSYMLERAHKRIRTPLATTVANGHSISAQQLTVPTESTN